MEVNDGVDHRIVRHSLVRGCETREIQYAPRARVQRGPLTRPLLTITLSGCAMESGVAGVVARRLMNCSLLLPGESSVADVCDDGWRVLAVELSEPWARDRVDQLGLTARSGSSSASTY